jgi:hypothetical protein
MKLAGFVNHVIDCTKMFYLKFKNHRRRRYEKKRRKNRNFFAVGKKTHLAIKSSSFFSRFHITKYGILLIQKKNSKLSFLKAFFATKVDGANQNSPTVGTIAVRTTKR